MVYYYVLFFSNDVNDRRLKMMMNESEDALNELEDLTLENSHTRRQINEV